MVIVMANQEFRVMEGSPGLEIKDLVHVMIPGGGRNDTGDDLSDISRLCANRAAQSFILIGNHLSRYSNSK